MAFFGSLKASEALQHYGVWLLGSGSKVRGCAPHGPGSKAPAGTGLAEPHVGSTLTQGHALGSLRPKTLALVSSKHSSHRSAHILGAPASFFLQSPRKHRLSSLSVSVSSGAWLASLSEKAFASYPCFLQAAPSALPLPPTLPLSPPPRRQPEQVGGQAHALPAGTPVCLAAA